MSWMDSWSRPKKSAATPPPLYLVSSGADQARYCHTCGRVIGSRKSNTSKSSAASEVKYCSDRCKRHKLRPIDRRIEAAFAALLDEQDVSHLAAVPGECSTTTTEGQTDQQQADSKAPNKKKHQKVKGDPRIIISCSEVEELIFGTRADPEKTFGRKKNRARRGVPDSEVWKSVDMEEGASDTDTDPGTASAEDLTDEASHSAEEGGVTIANDNNNNNDNDNIPDEVKLKGRVRPPQSESEVNGSIGGEKGWAEKVVETPEMLQKRREGQRRAEEKEMVKCAARRAVVFGLDSVGERKVPGPKKGKKRGDDDEEEKEVGKRLCEAVMQGAVVEPSFAKGDWGIRWREGS